MINNRLINWANTGVLYNVEAGCYNAKYDLNQLAFLQNPSSQNSDATSFIQLNGQGCVRYVPRPSSAPDSPNESLEFSFKTQSDQSVLLDTPGSEFLVHTQGPAIVIRNKDDSYSKAILERGIAFNDGEWHTIRLDKSEQKVNFELDGKYKQEFPLTRRNKLTPFHLGCPRGTGADDRQLKFKLNELKNFKGRVRNVVYQSGSSSRVNLGERLDAGDAVALVEGVVQWNSDGSKKSRQQPGERAVGLRENSFLKLDKVNFDQNSNISFWFKVISIRFNLIFINFNNNFNVY